MKAKARPTTTAPFRWDKFEEREKWNRDNGKPSYYRVCVDWHKTLEKGGKVSDQDMDGLDELLKGGEIKVQIISYAGYRRRDQVILDIRNLLGKERWGALEGVRVCDCRVGRKGKHHWPWKRVVRP